MDDLSKYIKEEFNVDQKTFLETLKLSPNARGYIFGAISEFLLQDHLIANGYEILRIREKWEGEKHPHHHGDFYVRKKGKKDWFVLESKGVKSNSEKWHRLYNFENLVSFLTKNIDKTPFKSKEEIEEYIKNNLPLFSTKYATNLYTFNEIKKYKPSKKITQKTKDIRHFQSLSLSELEKLIDERLEYVMNSIKVLETHLVSGGSKKSSRTQATPRIDEFNILCLDLCLRTGRHEFIFSNPRILPPSGSDKNHLQQNYVVDILFKNKKEEPKPKHLWTSDFNSIFKTLKNPVKEKDMQVDERSY